jgi:excisionase family DNA binding protein
LKSPDHGFESPVNPINLLGASKRYRIGIRSLRELVDKGSLRCRERRPHGRGESIVFEQAELEADLAALPPCQAAGCKAAGTGPSGYCGRHFGQGGRARAVKAERDLLGAERDWYTFREAWAEAPCSPTTLSKAIKAGKLSAQLVGRHTRIAKAELHEWAKSLPGNRGAGGRKPSAAQLEARREHVARLHAQGQSPGQIAQRIGRSKPTVYRDLKAMGIRRVGEGRRARRLSPAGRERRRERAAELYSAGQSLEQIAPELDSSPTQIRRDLEALGVEIRPPRRQSRYAQPTERPCEHCGASFAPRYPSGDGREGGEKRREFCSDACARNWRASQGRAALARRGLLSTGEVAEALGVGAHRVLDHIKQGRLGAERVSYPGMLGPTYGIAPQELQRFRREWARGGDGRREALLRPELVIARAERDGRVARMVEDLGLTTDVAHDLLRVQTDRRRRDRGIARKGRRPAGIPAARHLRWQERHRTFWEELERDRQDGLLERERSIDTLAYEATAEEDWREHPEDWPRQSYPTSPSDPDALDPNAVRPAVDRVRRAINRLQSAQTETRAA